MPGSADCGHAHVRCGWRAPTPCSEACWILLSDRSARAGRQQSHPRSLERGEGAVLRGPHRAAAALPGAPLVRGARGVRCTRSASTRPSSPGSTRLYAASSQINQAIVSTPDRDELLRTVCHVLVEQGGFKMAWIGWNDPATHRLVPVAVVGAEQHDVLAMQVYSDDRPEGPRPVGVGLSLRRAVRLQRPLERPGQPALASADRGQRVAVVGELPSASSRRSVRHAQRLLQRGRPLPGPRGEAAHRDGTRRLLRARPHRERRGTPTRSAGGRQRAIVLRHADREPAGNALPLRRAAEVPALEQELRAGLGLLRRRADAHAPHRLLQQR